MVITTELIALISACSALLGGIFTVFLGTRKERMDDQQKTDERNLKALEINLSAVKDANETLKEQISLLSKRLETQFDSEIRLKERFNDLQTDLEKELDLAQEQRNTLKIDLQQADTNIILCLWALNKANMVLKKHDMEPVEIKLIGKYEKTNINDIGSG